MRHALQPIVPGPHWPERPSPGQVIYEMAHKRFLMWTGQAWCRWYRETPDRHTPITVVS